VFWPAANLPDSGRIVAKPKVILGRDLPGGLYEVSERKTTVSRSQKLWRGFSFIPGALYGPYRSGPSGLRRSVAGCALTHSTPAFHHAACFLTFAHRFFAALAIAALPAADRTRFFTPMTSRSAEPRNAYRRGHFLCDLLRPLVHRLVGDSACLAAFRVFSLRA
jgi:hypothetical protein